MSYHYISWDEFEQRLIKAGWTPEEAHKERLRSEHGEMEEERGDFIKSGGLKHD